MKSRNRQAWMGVVVVNALLWCAFVAWRPAAAERSVEPAQINPAQQRADMIKELTEIKTLLKQQNELLQSGRVKVSVAE